MQGDNSPVLVKFPNFSTYEYLLNHQPPGLRLLLSEHYGTICCPSCACQLHLTVLWLRLFCDYHNCGITARANHNFPYFSLTISNFPDLFMTNVKFPEISRFYRWVDSGRHSQCSGQIFSERWHKTAEQQFTQYTISVS